MSARTCPWCGGPNLRISNCMGTHPLCKDGAIYWEDRDCGYREETTHNERYDYKEHKFVKQDYTVLRWHKPRAPLPTHQLPEYLREIG